MMNFISRNRGKALVALAGIAVAGVVAEGCAAAVEPAKQADADSRPRVELVRPRRITVALRLQTNATLAAFEETICSPRSPDTCPRFASTLAIT